VSSAKQRFNVLEVLPPNPSSVFFSTRAGFLFKYFHCRPPRDWLVEAVPLILFAPPPQAKHFPQLPSPPLFVFRLAFGVSSLPLTPQCLVSSSRLRAFSHEIGEREGQFPRFFPSPLTDFSRYLLPLDSCLPRRAIASVFSYFNIFTSLWPAVCFDFPLTPPHALFLTFRRPCTTFYSGKVDDSVRGCSMTKRFNYPRGNI